jgi:hypothetical protein
MVETTEDGLSETLFDGNKITSINSPNRTDFNILMVCLQDCIAE